MSGIISGSSGSAAPVLISDRAGNSGLIGSFGEQLVGQKVSDISVQFQYDVLNTEFDLNATETAVTGDGVNSATASYSQASSATTGTATIQSKDFLRYRPGHTGFADFTAYFSGTGTGEAGIFDDNDGFKLKVTNGVASFCYIKGGVETGLVSQSSWNGDADLNNIDWETLNIFRITFGYLGVANPTLWIKKNTWQILTTLRTEGVLTGTHVNNPVFPMRIKATNGMTVRAGSWDAGTIGQENAPGQRAFHFPTSEVISGAAAEQGEALMVSTNVNTIALFNSKTTFQGKVNKVKARLLSYAFHVDIPAGNVTGSVVFQIVSNPTLSGAASYVDVNTTSSVMQYDHTNGTGASVNATLGSPIITDYIEYTGSNRGGAVNDAKIDAERIGAIAYPGDTFALIAKDLGGNGVTVRAILNWEELF
jgi:hypothetical protein